MLEMEFCIQASNGHVLEQHAGETDCSLCFGVLLPCLGGIKISGQAELNEAGHRNMM